MENFIFCAVKWDCVLDFFTLSHYFFPGLYLMFFLRIFFKNVILGNLFDDVNVNITLFGQMTWNSSDRKEQKPISNYSLIKDILLF